MHKYFSKYVSQILIVFVITVTDTNAYFNPNQNFRKYSHLLNDDPVRIELPIKTKTADKKYHLLQTGLKISFPTGKFEQGGIINKDITFSLERIKLIEFLMSQKVKNPVYYTGLIMYKLDNWHERKLFASILVSESHGKLNQVSKKGAEGPWQVMPSWKRKFGVQDLQDPEQNLDTAIKVFNIHLADGKGDLWGYKGGMWGYNRSMHYVRNIKRLYDMIGSHTYFHNPVSLSLEVS